MATQHPDNASVPWWKGDAFVPTQDEIEEMTLLFEELPIDEYMWDWEGKYVDEAVGEKLFSRAQKLLAKKPLGEQIHLTYRIPAFDGGNMHRSARAFMNVLSLADLARDIGMKHPAVTEMFLPLTTSASQPLAVRAAFKEIAGYHRAIFHKGKKPDDQMLKLFEVTPLVEDVGSLLSIESIVRPYWESLVKEKKDMSDRGQRIFMARSDPAMNAGLVPAVLAVKAALSITADVGKSLGIKVHPVIGTGSLPFRGSVNPLYTGTFLEQYAGVATYSIQSGFRYDYEMKDVVKALKAIREQAPKLKPVYVPPADLKAIGQLAALFTGMWRPAIESIAPLINQVAAYVPPRRERLQHIGLFGYSRGIGKVRLPRAIGFTAALYSVGVPPEFITTGRGLRKAKELGLYDMIDKYYPALRADLQHAGKYLNRENLDALAKTSATFKGVKEDVAAIEEILGIELGPEKPHHFIHRNFTSTIFRRLKDKKLLREDAIKSEIVEAGIIRRSLG
ncbi:MAG TPA: phosphoenolpyruvate carboxylase [Candidatus Peribacteria bacterium]|nr:phosphoenolpyruvate carboxylase [Candidatus Peribacteria bacterium]